MDLDRSESRRSRYEDIEDSPVKKHRDDAKDVEDCGAEEEGEVQGTKESRHSSRDRDRKRNNGEGDKERERGRDRDREHRSKDSHRGYDKTKERDRGKDKSGRDSKEKNKERRDRDREKEYKHREKEREREWNRGKDREKVNDADRDMDRGKEKDIKKDHEDGAMQQTEHGEYDDKDSVSYNKKEFFTEQDVQRVVGTAIREPPLTTDLEERILKMKEERLRKDNEESDILSWVNKSRKLEEKRHAEKEKALQFSKLLEEQENMVLQDDEGQQPQTTHDLAGVKILHGLEKAIDGGSVVLTLKDQDILADGDINQEVEVLENVEIGEQKRRSEAYQAAKKKPGVYDKFNDDFSTERKILPQYDDPPEDEGITLDERGRFSGTADRKLEELRRRLEGSSGSNRFEDLTNSIKTSADYYTQEEMLQFKKPKKKKSLRKKEKLDVDALEAEAISTGLGAGDLGSRNDAKRKAQKEEEEKLAAQKRSNAYQSAYARADEISKLHKASMEKEDDDSYIDDDDDLNKSLASARRVALKKQAGNSSLIEIARLASKPRSENINENEEVQENRVIFTEVEEFVWGLQLDEDTQKQLADDVFKEEEDSPMEETETVKEIENVGMERAKEKEEGDELQMEETLHERPVGKGLSGVLSLLKDRGALKETVNWGGRNMDKKKSKLVGIASEDNSNEKFKDIRIERTDEFGRIMTPKEAFRRISHKFHGKGPGKMKQEKRMKQYQEELKLKQMKNSDTPSLSVERMRETQAQLKTPYLILSGNAKNGNILDGSGLEKDVPGGLTPMLGDRKVEFFLGGMKRKSDFAASNVFKKPKS